ncbi:MAG: CHAD domain-containing protein [Pseudomonadota bacterium]|nr:CHAD domain-containing protein [Pseudomonadota bacterium]
MVLDKQIKKLLKSAKAYLEIPIGNKKQVESLHTLRVTARKLVSVSAPDTYQIKLFKHIIQSSNKLRDLDVFTTEILPAFPKKLQSSMTSLYKGLEEFREQLDIEFKLWLEADVLLEIQDLLTDSEQIKKESSGRPDKHKLEQNDIEKKLQKNIKLIQKVDIEDKHIHKARLKIKQLHYQLEHFYPQEEKLLKKCTYLQDELGHFHDLCQGIKLLKKYADLTQKENLTQYLKHLEKNKVALLHTIRSKCHNK